MCVCIYECTYVCICVYIYINIYIYKEKSPFFQECLFCVNLCTHSNVESGLRPMFASSLTVIATPFRVLRSPLFFSLEVIGQQS